MHQPSPQSPRSPSSVLIAGALVLVTVNVALLSFAILRVAAAPTATAAPTAPKVASAQLSSTDEPLANTVITFTARPSDAKLFLDDVPLPSNPFTTRVSKDGLTHSVRAVVERKTSKLERVERIRFSDEREIVVTVDGNEPSAVRVNVLPSTVKSTSPTAASATASPPRTRPEPAKAAIAAVATPKELRASAADEAPAAPAAPKRPNRPKRPIDDQL